MSLVSRSPETAGRTSGPAPRTLEGARSAVALLLLAAVDWIAVGGCLAVVWEVRERLLPRAFPELGPLLLTIRDYIATLYFLLPWTIAFAETGLYSGRVLFWEEARRALRACTLATVFAALVSFATHAGTRLSRLVLLGTWLATLFVVPIARHHAKRLLARLGLWRHRVLILGAGQTGGEVLERIRRNPVLGYQVVGFLDDDPAKLDGRVAGLPVVAPLSRVAESVTSLGVSEVLIALPRLPRERLLSVISDCEGIVTSIRLVPDMFGLATLGVETEDLDGVLMLHMRWNLAKPWNLAIKRTFDLIVASATFLVLSPLLVLAAVAIRLDSKGPVLFRQERVGRRWTRFQCLKFRTMHTDGERRLEQHLASHPEARDEWERYAKLKSLDPRVTPVGRFLRRLSFDELPQLINVLRGEMSLVGPRPYLPSEVEWMGQFGDTIVKAPPGMSGLWQVSGRSDLSFQQRLRLDEYYVRNWSLWLDVIVLLKTLGVVARREGAY